MSHTPQSSSEGGWCWHRWCGRAPLPRRSTRGLVSVRANISYRGAWWGRPAVQTPSWPASPPCSHQKEWNNAICSYMDGPRDRHTKWSKSEILRQMLHDNTYIWNLSSHCKHLLFFLLPLSFINSSPNYLLDVFISPHYHWILCSFKPPTFPPDLLYQ